MNERTTTPEVGIKRTESDIRLLSSQMKRILDSLMKKLTYNISQISKDKNTINSTLNATTQSTHPNKIVSDQYRDHIIVIEQYKSELNRVYPTLKNIQKLYEHNANSL